VIPAIFSGKVKDVDGQALPSTIIRGFRAAKEDSAFIDVETHEELYFCMNSQLCKVNCAIFLECLVGPFLEVNLYKF
jgi:hypothetical protein